MTPVLYRVVGVATRDGGRDDALPRTADGRPAWPSGPGSSTCSPPSASARRRSRSAAPRRTPARCDTRCVTSARSPSALPAGVGDLVGVRGPFGTDWGTVRAPTRRPVQDVVVVGRRDRPRPAARGGRRAASARSLTGGLRVFVLVGAREPGQVIFADDLEAWRRGRGRGGLTVDVAGTRLGRQRRLGHRPARERRLRSRSGHRARLRPEVMMRFTAGRSSTAGVDPGRIRVSLERNMQCGVGVVRALPARALPLVPGRPGPPLRRRRRRSCSPSVNDERPPTRAPTLAVWKFASCDGCQLSLLDCEDELLALGRSRADRPLHRDVAGNGRRPLRPLPGRGLDHHAGDVRADPGGPRRAPGGWSPSGPAPPPAGSRDCATSPPRASTSRTVYAHPEYIATLDTSTPISAHVEVDFELHGCPIDRHQLLEVITAYLAGRRPGDPGPHGVPGVQGAGHRLRAGGPGTPCLGPGDPGGLRGAVPGRRTAAASAASARPTPPTRVAGRPASSPAARRRSTLSRLFRTFNAERPAFREESMAQGASGAGHLDAPDRTGPGGARVTHGSPACTIGVEGLARVEGEGSLRVEVRDGEVTDVALEIFEPPRYFEALLGRAPLHRGPRHHGPHLRDLPGGLPDDRLRRDGGRLRGGGRRPDRRAAAAPLLRGVDPEPRAARLPAARSGLPRLRRRGGAGGARPGGGASGARAQAGRQPGDGDRRGAGGPPGQRPGGWLLPGPDAADVAALAEPLRRARDAALATVEWVAGFEFPDVDRRLPVRRPAGPGRYPIERRTAGLLGGPRRDAGRARRSGGRGARGALDGAPRSARRAGTRTSPGPWPGTPSTPRAAAPGPRGGRRAPVSGPVCTNPFRSIVVRAVELVFACDEALSLVEALRAPDPPAVPVTPRAGVGDRRHRGAAGSALPPLRDRRRGHDPPGPDRAADVAEPAHDRGGPARVVAEARSTSTTTSCSGAASRPSATTTRASRAPPTSSTSRCVRA